ncbi:MAG: hypothetical protein ACE5JO_13660 [Candidatus Binatia bacterium]
MVQGARGLSLELEVVEDPSVIGMFSNFFLLAYVSGSVQLTFLAVDLLAMHRVVAESRKPNPPDHFKVKAKPVGKVVMSLEDFTRSLEHSQGVLDTIKGAAERMRLRIAASEGEGGLHGTETSDQNS